MAKRLSYRFWTDQEIDGLRSEFPKTGANVLADTFGRTKMSIRRKAQQLGLDIDRTISCYANIDLQAITTHQWAYLAGIVDGEGSIFILRGKQARNGRPGHCLEMTVTNTSRPLIDWLLVTFGGTDRSSGKRGGSNRPQWAWVVRHHKAAEYLRQIIPHLVVKKGQAEVALQFLDSMCRDRLGTPLTEAVINERDAFKAEISRLNRRAA